VVLPLQCSRSRGTPDSSLPTTAVLPWKRHPFPRGNPRGITATVSLFNQHHLYVQHVHTICISLTGSSANSSFFFLSQKNHLSTWSVLSDFTTTVLSLATSCYSISYNFSHKINTLSLLCFKHSTVFTAQCYASTVYAVDVCRSVRFAAWNLFNSHTLKHSKNLPT